jgi:hypothetical protein
MIVGKLTGLREVQRLIRRSPSSFSPTFLPMPRCWYFAGVRTVSSKVSMKSANRTSGSHPPRLSSVYDGLSCLMLPVLLNFRSTPNTVPAGTGFGRIRIAWNALRRTQVSSRPLSSRIEFMNRVGRFASLSSLVTLRLRGMKIGSSVSSFFARSLYETSPSSVSESATARSTAPLTALTS